MEDKIYLKELESVIKQMLKPLKGVPFSLVIESICGCKVIPFDKKSSDDKKVLELLTNVAKDSATKINVTGIVTNRPNEAGNAVELFVKKIFKSLGFKSSSPLTKSGKKKQAGYPDLEFIDHAGRVNYLECKTFNISNISSSQRTFYLSPSSEFKVTKNAHHFIISFELYIYGKKKRKNVYRCKSWKVLSVDNLRTDVKYEFNADNLRLYSKEAILAEGDI